MKIFYFCQKPIDFIFLFCYTIGYKKGFSTTKEQLRYYASASGGALPPTGSYIAEKGCFPEGKRKKL